MSGSSIPEPMSDGSGADDQSTGDPGTGQPATGLPAVDEALARLTDLDERPVSEHHCELAAAHETLHAELESPPDRADGSPPLPGPRPPTHPRSSTRPLPPAT